VTFGRTGPSSAVSAWGRVERLVEHPGDGDPVAHRQPALVAARKNGTHTAPRRRKTAQKGGFLVAGAGFEPATSGL
jgi:hypothetical protein